jgi:hypothetical protein
MFPMACIPRLRVTKCSSHRETFSMSNVKPIWIEYINIGTVLIELVFKFSRVSFPIFVGYLHVLIWNDIYVLYYCKRIFFFSYLQVQFSKVSPGEPFIIGIQNICINLITVCWMTKCSSHQETFSMSNVKPIWIEYINIGTVLIEVDIFQIIIAMMINKLKLYTWKLILVLEIVDATIVWYM